MPQQQTQQAQVRDYPNETEGKYVGMGGDKAENPKAVRKYQMI